MAQERIDELNRILIQLINTAVANVAYLDRQDATSMIQEPEASVLLDLMNNVRNIESVHFMILVEENKRLKEELEKVKRTLANLKS